MVKRIEEEPLGENYRIDLSEIFKVEYLQPNEEHDFGGCIIQNVGESMVKVTCSESFDLITAESLSHKQSIIRVIRS